MDTRIIILSDNRTDNPMLETEHGLSVYLEYNGRKYLLDTELLTYLCVMQKNWV